MLVQRADINRSTFYLHYVDKYDLLDRIEGELFDEMQRKLPAEQIERLFVDQASMKSAMLSMAEYIHANGQLFMLLASKHGDPALIRKYGRTMQSTLLGAEIADKFTVPQNDALVALMA